MPGTHSDYIIRIIEQLGAALRRMKARLAGGTPAAAEVLDEAERCQGELFGPLWPTLRSVDAATAVALVADERRVRLWIEFVHLEAEAARQLGDRARAETMTRRAAELARALDTGGSSSR